MINYKFPLLLFLYLTFSGCSNQEARILDFAGIIFIIFSILLLFNLYFEKIISTNFVKKISFKIKPLFDIVPKIAYILGICAIVFGFILGKLYQINIFVGTIIIFFGWSCKQYNRGGIDEKTRARYGKIMMLCITFAICLILLMTSVVEKVRI